MTITQLPLIVAGVDVGGLRKGFHAVAIRDERALMAERVWCFSTPTRTAASAHPKGHYNWMLAGADLFYQLEPAYPLYTGGIVPAGRPMCFETFPHAVTCVLHGAIVSAKNKRIDRLAVLAQEGINLPLRPTMDVIDGAVCALAALYFARNAIKQYGEVESGFIVVPTRQPAA